MKRTLYYIAGLLCLLLGAVGVVLPLLPTTPFVILAAWCFSRSSERLHQWLLNHKLFGQLIKDWEAYGVIPFKIKCLTTTMMLVMVSYPLFFKPFDLLLKGLVVLVIAVALSYIWSRPSVPAATAVES